MRYLQSRWSTRKWEDVGRKSKNRHFGTSRLWAMTWQIWTCLPTMSVFFANKKCLHGIITISPFFFSFFCRNKWWFCISMLRLLSAHGCCAWGAWNMMMLICKARARKKQTTRSQDQRCWPPIAGTTNKGELSTHWRKNCCQNIFTNKLWDLGRNEFPVLCTIFKYPHIRCFNPTKNKSAYGSMWLYSPLQGGAYVINMR